MNSSIGILITIGITQRIESIENKPRQLRSVLIKEISNKSWNGNSQRSGASYQ